MRTVAEILEQSRTIAVVGASDNPSKAAHLIPKAMQKRGFRIIPVNPVGETILGERAYASLSDIPEPVDIVDVFRPAAEAAGIAEQAVALGAKALWLQLGISSEDARAIADAAGIDYVENKCIKVEAMTRSISHTD